VYTPSQKILQKYAHVLVNFALGGTRGIKKGDVVRLMVGEEAKPLYAELCRAIWKAGGNVISAYLPSEDRIYNLAKDFYTYTKESQVTFFPKKYYRGLIDEVDHELYIHSYTDPYALKGIDPRLIMKRGMAMKPFMDWRREKENRGKLSWTIGLYGTPAMAKAAGMSEKEYWSEIIRACFLDFANPIAKWKDVYRKMEAYRKKLNALPIETLRVTGKDADLTIALGNRRRWMSGRGANIPSFEIFTSPDWRGTEGWIRFSEPLYRYGNLIKGIELEFKKGKVVSARAKKNEKVLQAMLAAKNADKVGEFSLTDRRFSRITTFMANTLYDENVGGPQGNTHIAVGAAYHDCFTGEKVKMKKKDWRRLGFNDSSVHTDMVSTTARTVTARLEGGKDKVIYTDGEFVL
jgi:aminopeptidase